MKKLIAMIISLMMLMTCLAGCGGTGSSQDSGDEASVGFKIVTTIFPEYDWVREILGDNPAGAEVILLTDKGVDLHSYQPNAEDIMNISSCGILIYVGGGSDSFIDDVLSSSSNEEMTVLNMMDIIGDSAKEEEIIEGMESDEHEHDEDSEPDEDGPEYDEHVWLSLRNAEKLTSAICDAICEADPDHTEMYKENLNSYLSELDSLDKEYEDVVSKASNKTLLFGDRFPFRYMVDDYGLDYYAAFAGCSAESEASFETVTFLAGKVDELGLDYVFTIENSDGKIANTIIDNTKDKDQKVLSLNSMQSVLRSDIDEGATYLGIMQENLDALKEALGE